MSIWLALTAAALIDTTAAPPAAPPSVPSPIEVGRANEPLPDSYYTRLTIHRWSSYAMLPLFALQYAAGQQLLNENGDEADWAESAHAIGATGIAAVFATNVVTGVPNLIAIWNEPRDRPRRLFHASAMLIASAGFVATAIIADEAEDGSSGRNLHRTVALSSMGVATIGYFSMLDVFRRD